MYQYIKGEWKAVQSTLDKAKDHMHLSLQLKALGFQTPQEFVDRGGDAQLYSRNAPLSAPPYPFEFCCVLHVGNGHCPVGLKDLHDVQLFLEEIDAHPREAPPLDLSWLKTTLNQLNNTMAELSNTLDHILSPQPASGGKSPAPEDRATGTRPSWDVQIDFRRYYRALRYAVHHLPSSIRLSVLPFTWSLYIKWRCYM